MKIYLSSTYEDLREHRGRRKSPPGGTNTGVTNSDRPRCWPHRFAARTLGALTSRAACATPTLTLSWQVQYAAAALLTRDGVPVAQRAYADPCQLVSDSATETLPPVSGGVTYTLTVFNPDGVATGNPLAKSTVSAFRLSSSVSDNVPKAWQQL